MGFYSASPGQARVEDPQWVHHCLSTCSIFSLRPLSKKKPSLSTSRSARPIDRMVGVQRPPIQSNVGAKPARLDHPLRRIMAPFAQAHERTEPEFIDVPTMRLDVITDFCRRDDAALQTELAERMREQLLLPDPPQRPELYQAAHFVGWPRPAIVHSLSSNATLERPGRAPAAHLAFRSAT